MAKKYKLGQWWILDDSELYDYQGKRIKGLTKLRQEPEVLEYIREITSNGGTWSFLARELGVSLGLINRIRKQGTDFAKELEDIMFDAREALVDRCEETMVELATYRKLTDVQVEKDGDGEVIKVVEKTRVVEPNMKAIQVFLAGNSNRYKPQHIHITDGKVEAKVVFGGEDDM